MAKIIFVNRYFYPDHSATSQLLSDLVLGPKCPRSQQLERELFDLLERTFELAEEILGLVRGHVPAHPFLLVVVHPFVAFKLVSKLAVAPVPVGVHDRAFRGDLSGDSSHGPG